MLKANPHTIWASPENIPQQPPLTNEALTTFEAEVGLKLPQALVDLLKVQNGGYLRFEYPDLLNDKICGIGSSYEIGSLFRLDQEDLGYLEGEEPFPLDELIAFDGDGHWYLCLDYRRHLAEPEVTYLDVEGMEPSQTWIAPSFQVYLDHMQPKTDDDVYILDSELGWSLEEILVLLEVSLQTTFREPKLWSNRPDTRKAKFCYRGENEWIWIGPNLKIITSEDAPAGVKPDEARASERDVRYPFLKADSFLMEISPDACERVLDILSEEGLNVRHLREYITA